MIAFGMAPMPVWSVAPSGMRSAIERRDALVEPPSVPAGGPRGAGSRPRIHPTIWLTWTWLRPNVRGIAGLASRKNRARPMNEET